MLGRAGKPSRNTLGKIGCGGGVVGKKTGVKKGGLEGVFCDFGDAKYKDWEILSVKMGKRRCRFFRGLARFGAVERGSQNRAEFGG